MATIKLAGKAINTNGDLPEINQIAPDFELITDGLKPVGLNKFKGEIKVLSIVPSLDTDLCAKTTEQFNDRAQHFPDIAFITISADLPFAIQRFRKKTRLKPMSFLSMMRSRDFARDYGVLIIDGPMQGLAARSVLILDEDNRVLYTELVDDIVNEPNYDAVVSELSG